jgi:hypothetical protein
MAEIQPTPASPSASKTAKTVEVPRENPFTAFRRQIPAPLLTWEPKPITASCVNPVVDERGAANLLGVSQDLMKKWRQRKWGPNYIQYGENGPVRYELNEITEFRAFHGVQVRSNQ